MFEMMTSKMTIDFNILSLFMKNRVASNLNKVLVITIHKNKMRKKLSYIQVTKQFIF